MIVGTSLEAEGRVLERADQEGGCSAAAWAASSSAAQGLQGMLAAVQCAVCECWRALARSHGALQPKTICSACLLVSYRPLAIARWRSVRGPYYLGVGSISDSLSHRGVDYLYSTVTITPRGVELAHLSTFFHTEDSTAA